MIHDETFSTEHHPWNHYIPPNAKTLIVGTFPSAKRNWSFDFFYPNKRNFLWQVLAAIDDRQILHLENESAVAERKEILESLQVGVTDMGKRVKRYQQSSLDENLALEEAMDIFQLLTDHPSIKKIILTSSSGRVSALRWFIQYLTNIHVTAVVPKGKRPSSFIVSHNTISVEIHVLYSPSPRASNRISFLSLVDMYRRVIVDNAVPR